MRKSAFPFFAFAGLVIFLVSYWTYGYFGHYGYDDISYARIAHQYSLGNFQALGDNAALRWGLVVPLAVLYKLFGVSDCVSLLYPILATIFLCFLVYQATPNKQTLSVFAACVLLFLNPPLLQYSNKIAPDILVAVAVFAALLSILVGNQKPFLGALLFAISLFFGVISKETLLLIAPLLFFLFCKAIFQYQNNVFWKWSIVFSVIVTCIYFGLTYWQCGDILARIKYVEAGHYLNPCSYNLLPISALLHRIGHRLWQGLSETLLLWGFPFVVVNGWHWRSLNQEGKYWTTCTFGLLLCANFMTTSYSSYVPLCPDARHYFFVVPAIACAATFSFRFIKESGQARLVLLLAVAGQWLLAWWGSSGKIPVEWSCFFLLTVVLVAWKRKRSFYVFISLFCILSFWKPYQDMQYNHRSNYRQFCSYLIQNFSQRHQRILIFTNPVACHVGSYLMQFDTTKVRFESYATMSRVPLQNFDSIFLIHEGMTAYLSSTSWGDLPDIVQHPPRFLQLQTERPALVYRVENRDSLRTFLSQQK